MQALVTWMEPGILEMLYYTLNMTGPECTLPTRAGRSPTFWTLGLAFLGLAGTRGLASPIEELLSFKTSSSKYIFDSSTNVTFDSALASPTSSLKWTRTRESSLDPRVPINSSTANTHTQKVDFCGLDFNILDWRTAPIEVILHYDQIHIIGGLGYPWVPNFFGLKSWVFRPRNIRESFLRPYNWLLVFVWGGITYKH